MVESGSMEYTRAKCTSLKGEIMAEIESLGGNPQLVKLIEALDVQIKS
jgi:geranylgeranyl diphosphate synthase type 3